MKFVREQADKKQRGIFMPIIDKLGKNPTAAGTIAHRGLRRSGGPQLLTGLLDLYQSGSSRLILTQRLSDLAHGAKNIRVRYGALLLLDKILQQSPNLQGSVLFDRVRKDLAALATDRAAKTKWYLTAMLPKTDQHVHIDGSVRLETLMDLADRQGVDLAQVLEASKQDEHKKKALADVPSLPRNPTLLDIQRLSQIEGVQPDFFKVLILGFDFAISVMQTKEGLERTAYELVEDSWREGVMHLNAIFAPCLHRKAGLGYDEVIEVVVAGLEKGKRDFGVTWELSLGIYRGFYTDKYPEHPMETAQAAKRFAFRYPHQIGIDVVGAEFEMPLDHFRDEFEALRDSDVILRAHAAEMPKHAFNLETALEWGIERLGHGIYVHDLAPAEVLRVKNSMILEVSPTSNLKCLCLGEGSQLGDHPIARLMKEGFRVTLCTDDRTVMITNNVSQMLALEEALPGWKLFRGNRLSGLPFTLAKNGFDAIADKTVSLPYRRDLMPWITQINRLMEIIAG